VRQGQESREGIADRDFVRRVSAASFSQVIPEARYDANATLNRLSSRIVTPLAAGDPSEVVAPMLDSRAVWRLQNVGFAADIEP